MLMIVIFALLPAQAAKTSFYDVESGAWYEAAIAFAFDKEYMLGVDNRIFEPHTPVSRAMLATVLYRISGSRATYSNSSFTDNPKGAWYFTGVEFCYRNEIVFGYGDGRFGPNQPLRREDMMAMFYRFATVMRYDSDENERDILSSYADKKQVSAYAVSAANWCLNNGVVSGMNYTEISPRTGATRAQLAQVLMNFAEHILRMDVSKYRKSETNPYGIAVQNVRYYQDCLDFHLTGLDRARKVQMQVQYLLDGKVFDEETISIAAYRQDYDYNGDATVFQNAGPRYVGMNMRAQLRVTVFEEENKVFRTTVNIGKLFQKSPEGTPLYFKGEAEMDCRILLYHEFYETAPEESQYGVISTPERFEENIKLILERGYTVIPLYALLEYDQGLRALPQKSVILTFDDGYESNYTMIYPLLQQYGAHATIFINVLYMGFPGKLTWDQMREMEESGLVEIQSHSLVHNDHTTLTEEELRTQVSESFSILENELGKRASRMFAYPYGRKNAQTENWVGEYEVAVQLTTVWRALDMEHLNFNALPRFTVSYTADIDRILLLP